MENDTVEIPNGASEEEQPKPKAPPPASDETDWKVEARKWESRAKENAAAAQKLSELEEASKTEAERNAERLANAERRAAELEIKAVKAGVAASKGVPTDLLIGTTLEELEASADALLAFRGEQKQTDRATYYIPDEGGFPVIGKNISVTPGIGSLRAGYAQSKKE